jgi:hypothetical protein
MPAEDRSTMRNLCARQASRKTAQAIRNHQDRGASSSTSCAGHPGVALSASIVAIVGSDPGREQHFGAQGSEEKQLLAHRTASSAPAVGDGKDYQPQNLRGTAQQPCKYAGSRTKWEAPCQGQRPGDQDYETQVLGDRDLPGLSFTCRWSSKAHRLTLRPPAPTCRVQGGPRCPCSLPALLKPNGGFNGRE